MKTEKGKGKNKKTIVSDSLVDDAIVEGSVQIAMKDARFTAWSVPGKALLNYLSETTPRFSQSKEVAFHLKRGLKAKYPKLWKSIKKQIKQNGSINKNPTPSDQ
jgi:hypothetical protein